MSKISERDRLEKEQRIGRLIKLPLSKALEISFKSLLIRFGRSLITTCGIFLTIAFLTYVLISSGIAENIFGSSEGMEQEVVAKQYWLLSLSLLICLVGISNGMLMSVTERFKEIGTMKCLGALDRFVVELFLLESSFQGLVGSLSGAVTGALAAYLKALLNRNADSTVPSFGVFLTSVLCAVVIGVVLAVIGAMYPAYRAAQMLPADAMRTEI
ncbi:ABC transporter permease [Candidatus Hydrogenedentota bacterium]